MTELHARVLAHMRKHGNPLTAANYDQISKALQRNVIIVDDPVKPASPIDLTPWFEKPAWP